MIVKELGKNKKGKPNKYTYIENTQEYQNDMKELHNHIKEVFRIAKKHGVKNPLNKDKWIEMVASAMLSHNCNIGCRGPDALNKELNFAEYKSAERKGSYQFHWLSANSVVSVNALKQMIAIVRNGAELEEILSITGEALNKVIAEVSSKSTNTEEIGAHKSFSYEKLLEMGASVILTNKK